MKRYFASILLIISLSALSGCYSQGTSAPAPTNVNVVAGDSSATLTWDMAPGVEYWIFKAAGSDISPLSCFGMPQCQIIANAVSPTVVSGLANGTNYAFTINGRVNGGKGGPGSPVVQAVPRLAGALWTVATTAGTADLRGVTYGTVFVAAGNGGALFSSTDGMAWTAQTSTPPTTANLDAASFYGSSYVVAGAGGVILLSTDAITWTPQTSNTPNDLYAVSNYGAAGFVATGAAGTVIHSVDGGTWTGAIASNTTNPLYAVTYGNGLYAAVGAAGTLITSPDGATWSSPSSISASDLKGIAYAPLIGTNGAGTFVAVGASGTIITSTDGGTTWAAATSPFASTAIITSVTYGRQFVAVANDGSIFTSIDGLSWAATASTPANTAPLYAVTHGIYDYSAVGAAGLNTHSM